MRLFSNRWCGALACSKLEPIWDGGLGLGQRALSGDWGRVLAFTALRTSFGALVYDRVVPQGHFFRRLNEAVDWRPFTQKLLRYYKGGAEYGPPP